MTPAYISQPGLHSVNSASSNPLSTVAQRFAVPNLAYLYVVEHFDNGAVSATQTPERLTGEWQMHETSSSTQFHLLNEANSKLSHSPGAWACHD